MMRLISSRRGAPGGAPGTVCRAGVLLLLFSTSLAAQPASIGDGVYAAAQAARGRRIYESRCAECHGPAMEGGSGPPLVGAAFLANYSARPLVDLVDKIQKTMPFNLPADLSRPEAIDLAGVILEAGGFRAGAELVDARLAQIVFPAAPAARAPVEGAAAAGTALPPPEGNLAELMRAIAFPNSNVIFNVQLKDPGGQPPKPPPVPFDYVEWGSTVYPGWLAVDQAAVALTETAALLLTPGRRCQNGRPAPVDNADWRQYVGALVDAGRAARRASQARNAEAFVAVSEQLNEACAACHKVYRDRGGAEGSGASRCQ